MRWKRQLEPKIGDQVVVECFAILPTTMSDNITVVWLEHYYALVEYVFCFDTFGDKIRTWREVQLSTDWSDFPGRWVLTNKEFKSLDKEQGKTNVP